MKSCRKCKVQKPITSFWKDSARKDGLYALCKECASKINKSRKFQRRLSGSKVCITCSVEKPVLEFGSKRISSDGLRSDCKECAYYSSILRKYGLTRVEHDGILDGQSGVCGICSKVCSTGYKLCVDHCHETGKVRGLLCKSCNTSLGKLGDNLEGIMKVVRYLEANG